jgi:hypothetical protein
MINARMMTCIDVKTSCAEGISVKGGCGGVNSLVLFRMGDPER